MELKKIKKSNILFCILGLLLISVLLVVTKFLPRFFINKRNRKPQTCFDGPLSEVAVTDFVYGLPKQNFSMQIQDALENIRVESADFQFRGVRYTDLDFKPRFYFVSVNEKKFVSTDGNKILSSYEGAFATRRQTIEDEAVEQIMSPLKAIEISKPILNCYKDYPSRTDREVRLLIDNKTGEVSWIVTVKDFMINVPGPNIRHFVKVDAFRGEVLEYD